MRYEWIQFFIVKHKAIQESKRNAFYLKMKTTKWLNVSLAFQIRFMNVCKFIYASLIALMLWWFRSFKYHELFHKWTHFQQEIVSSIKFINHEAYWRARLQFYHKCLKWIWFPILTFGIEEETTSFLFINVMKFVFEIVKWTILFSEEITES